MASAYSLRHRRRACPVGLLIAPTIIAASSWYIALVGGALSGLAATGGNQVFKQAIKLICEKRGIDYKNAEPIADKIDEVLTGESKKE